MALREQILRIANGWPAYRDIRTTDSDHPIHRLVTEVFPAELARIAENRHALKHDGSCGLGNISTAPWIATFDLRLTNSAQDGYYPVYLFSTDLQRVYLSFGLGVTQFDRHFGKNNTSISKMREGAERVRGLCEGLGPPARLSQTTIDLSASSGARNYRAYEAGTILAFPPYVLSDLPSDELLESDYREVIEFYIRLVEDPTIPEVEELVEASVQLVEPSIISEMRVFEPRPPARARGQGSRGGKQRRSKESRKVGNAGEIAVVAAEKQRLIEAGFPNLADQVDHLAARGQTPGWDIASFDEEGHSILIEVKASKGKSINSIEITRNEWLAAQAPTNRGRYFIYLVTDALSVAPQIEVIKDPFGYVENNVLTVEPSTWELSLRNRE